MLTMSSPTNFLHKQFQQIKKEFTTWYTRNENS